MRDYKAVLFDFDYTLGDTESSILAGFFHAFEAMGLPRPDAEAVKATIGYPLAVEYTMLTGDSDAEHTARFRKLYTEKANPIQIAETRLFPGGEALVRALHAAGVPVAVVSSKRTATLRAILDNLGLTELFASLTGGDLVQAPKPDPEGLLAAVAALGLTPDQVLYCGDTTIDAETAQRAGAPFSAVLNGTTPAEAFAAYPSVHIAPDLVELHAWLGL